MTDTDPGALKAGQRVRVVCEGTVLGPDPGGHTDAWIRLEGNGAVCVIPAHLAYAIDTAPTEQETP